MKPDPTFQWTAGLELLHIFPLLPESPLDYSLSTFCSFSGSHAAVCFKCSIVSTSNQVSNHAFSENLTDSSVWIQGSSCIHLCFLEFLLFSRGQTVVHMAAVMCLPAIWKITTLSRSHQYVITLQAPNKGTEHSVVTSG